MKLSTCCGSGTPERNDRAKSLLSGMRSGKRVAKGDMGLRGRSENINQKSFVPVFVQ
jgi:hypothetical protein